MHIVNQQPWSLIQRFRRELDEAFAGPEAAQPQWTPSVDVREDADRYTLHADLPGVESKDIQVTADDGVLTLRGERRTEAQQQAGGYAWYERRNGSFLRRFSLPDNVLPEQIKARHTNGVLEIVIPKQPVAEPRRINVEVN